MYSDKINQVATFIENEDMSLAIRRILDLVKETQDINLIAKSTHLCAQYRLAQEESPDNNTENRQILESLLAEIGENLSHKQKNVSEIPLLSVVDISKRYPKSNFTLDNVSVEIYAGEVVGVVGENGNGKTTLLNCIAGYLAIDSGGITYYFLESQDYDDIKEGVAIIPQRIPKWYGSLKENLHFSAAVAGSKGERNNIEVEYMIERLGLTAFANHTWNELSSGYRTRFEIARVLLTKPTLLVLDEPLANLDINAQQTLLADLKYICESEAQPLGIILSSQQLYEVEKIADKIILLKQGSQINLNERMNTEEKCVIEFETDSNKQTLEKALEGEQVHITYDGNYFTLVSHELPLSGILKKFLQENIEIKYYRDITKSTKRFF